MENIEITSKHKTMAEQYISLFENIKFLKKENISAYNFLKSVYLPEYTETTMPSIEAIKRKVITEIYLKEDIENQKIKADILKQKKN